MRHRWTVFHRAGLAATLVLVAAYAAVIHFDTSLSDHVVLYLGFFGLSAVWIALGLSSLAAFWLEQRGRWRWYAVVFSPYVAAAAYDAAAVLGRLDDEEAALHGDVVETSWREFAVSAGFLGVPSLAVFASAAHVESYTLNPVFAVAASVSVGSVLVLSYLLTLTASQRGRRFAALRRRGVAVISAAFAALVFASTVVVAALPDVVFDPAPFGSLLAYPVALFSLPVFTLVQMEPFVELLVDASGVFGPAVAVYILYLTGVALAVWTVAAPVALTGLSERWLITWPHVAGVAAVAVAVAVLGLAGLSHSVAFLAYAEEPTAPPEPEAALEPEEMALQQAEHDSYHDAAELYDEFVRDEFQFNGFTSFCYTVDRRDYDEETWLEVECRYTVEAVDEWGVRTGVIPAAFHRTYRVEDDEVQGYDVPVVGDTPMEPDAELSGADIRYMDVSDLDLSGVDMTNARLEGVDFSDSDLSGASLENASMEDVDMTDSVLHRASLDGVTAAEVEFHVDSAVESTWRNASVRSSSYRGDLSRSNFDHVEVRGSVFWHTNLDDASIRGATLRDVEVARDSSFQRVDARNSTLDDVEFTVVDLDDADFTGAEATNVEIEFSSTSGCSCP